MFESKEMQQLSEQVEQLQQANDSLLAAVDELKNCFQHVKQTDSKLQEQLGHVADLLEPMKKESGDDEQSEAA